MDICWDVFLSWLYKILGFLADIAWDGWSNLSACYWQVGCPHKKGVEGVRAGLNFLSCCCLACQTDCQAQIIHFTLGAMLCSIAEPEAKLCSCNPNDLGKGEKGKGKQEGRGKQKIALTMQLCLQCSLNSLLWYRVLLCFLMACFATCRSDCSALKSPLVCISETVQNLFNHL